MVKSILHNNKLIGYYLDEKYYRLDDMKNLDINISSSGSLKCIKVGSKYLTEFGQVVVWSHLRNSDSYKELLRKCKINNIKINTNIYIKRIAYKSLQQLKYQYNLSSYWGRNSNCYEIISCTGDTLGVVKFKQSDNSLSIGMIEIIEKNKGYGTQVIDKLKSDYKLPITGYSCIEAKDFWLKQGAVFTSDYDFIINI